jgi:hypothetical protein
MTYPHHSRFVWFHPATAEPWRDIRLGRFIIGDLGFDLIAVQADECPGVGQILRTERRVGVEQVGLGDTQSPCLLEHPNRKSECARCRARRRKRRAMRRPPERRRQGRGQPIGEVGLCPRGTNRREVFQRRRACSWTYYTRNWLRPTPATGQAGNKKVGIFIAPAWPIVRRAKRPHSPWSARNANRSEAVGSG